MKIRFNVDFVMNIEIPSDNQELCSLTDLALRQMMLGASAQAWENMFQEMLIKTPEMIKAEVMKVEEYNES